MYGRTPLLFFQPKVQVWPQYSGSGDGDIPGPLKHATRGDSCDACRFVKLEHVSARLNRGIPWDVWMMESSGIDSIFGGRSIPKPCSLDLRERVVETVESGASRREAAERFEVSASSAIKWMQRWRKTGSVAAKPSGGSISALEERADFLLTLIVAQPDLTLDEIVVAMRKRRIAGSRSAVWRFFKRHNISFKKKPAGGGARASGRGPRTAALDARTGHV